MLFQPVHDVDSEQFDLFANLAVEPFSLGSRFEFVQLSLDTVGEDGKESVQVLLKTIVHGDPPFSVIPVAAGDDIIGERGSYGKKGGENNEK